jgi:two-component system sensor histidine kinase BaeS
VEVELGELLEACRAAHAAQASTADITLRVETAGRATVFADPGRLRQALGNLIGNALRHTPPGGTVTLRLVPHGELATIQVQDTGSGIPPEHLPHLFDRFWRADAARGRDTGGSGLGLSIARQILTDHRATVDVESTVGEGTVFTVVLATV